uniref:F-box domain-containing protein n=1 Tax=Seriola dumerili TaxID=41447 RepID=A0A3B4VM46_SERDU
LQHGQLKTMAQPPSQLPSEVWNHVFGYLSAADKFNVRASCKYFKKLVDHGSLWKDWAVVLSFQNGPYNSQFWATLRRRRVTSVVVRSSKAKDWKQLAHSLPAVTTVVMDQSSQKSLDCLKDFPHLKRLAIRSSCSSLSLDASTVSKPQQLTHFSMCDVTFPTAAMGSVISAVSHFTNLISLVCHQMGVFEETILMVHSILNCLPKLKHLSLSVVHRLCTFHSIPRPNPGPSGGAHGQAGAPALSSLELIDCMDHSLPEDAMRLMPGLKSLAVFYRHSHQEMLDRRPSPVCHLKTWLSDLPQLSTLVIVKGPPVKKYVTSIPATVTNLTLCVAGLSSGDMGAVAVQVPNLLHLHIDPWPSHLGARTAQIPQLFPKLKRLKLRHEHVPEKNFLRLHQLQDLEYLEILDSRPHLSELTAKLQALTNYRVELKNIYIFLNQNSDKTQFCHKVEHI